MQISNDYLIVLKKLKEIGMSLKDGFGKAVETGKKDESAFSYVTEFDVRAEEFLHDEMKKYFPDIGFVGEEFGKRDEKDKFWLVDPIDGTTFFMRGIPFCTSMIALIDKGEVIFSAIYNFISDEMYVAEKGNGAWKNKKRIHVSSRTLKDSFIVYSNDFKGIDDFKNLKYLRSYSQLLQGTVMGWDLCMVAEGKLDGKVVISSGTKDWDIAPGALLVKEAGGEVVNLGTNEFDYKNKQLILANKTIYKELTSGNDALYPIIK